MKSPYFANKILLTAVISVFCLAGCGNTERQQSPVQQIVKKFAKTTALTGKVTGQDQAITSGLIKVIDNAGHLLTTQALRGDSHYRLEIPADTAVPVILVYFPQPDSLETEQLRSVVIEPSITRYDISPLTTAIANGAKALGGYTRANLVMAAENKVNVPDANKTSTGFRGDPTQQYGGWH